MDQQTNPVNDEITLTDILLFIKRYFVKILVRGFISVLIVLVIAVLAWFFLPCEKRYYFEVENTLKKNNTNTYVYPNERAFNSQDIVSPIVLREVYTKLKLQDKLPYDKFSALFYIDNSSFKLALLDAEYAAKLSKKNLNTVNIGLLEKEYQGKKRQLENNIFSINMKSHFALTPAECIQIVSSIPEVWYSIYSQTESSSTLPKVELETWKQIFARSAADKNANLMALEKARIYCKQLQDTCQALREMLDGKNISLESGELLEDIERQLEHIYKFQISVYAQYIVMSPTLYTPHDNVFMIRSLKDIKRQVKTVDENIHAAEQALDLIQANAPAKKTAQVGNAGNSTVNFDFNESILSQITTLIRNDITNSIRRDIAKTLLTYGEEKAELVAEHEFIEDLLSNQKNNTTAKELLTPAEFRNKINGVQNDILVVAGKLQQFRNKITQKYFSSRLFYKPAGNHIKIKKDYILPLPKVIIGLFALAFLCNIGLICWDFKFKYQR